MLRITEAQDQLAVVLPVPDTFQMQQVNTNPTAI